MNNFMALLAIVVLSLLLVVNVQFALFYALKGKWITSLFLWAFVIGTFSGWLNAFSSLVRML
jgi:hypothetical protein